MSRFKRLNVLNAMIKSGAIPVFYDSRIEVAKKILAACAAGGATVVEFTNRADRAHLVFTELAEYCATEFPNMILGIGSINDAPTAALYIAAGADFVVSPSLNPEIARLCNRRKIAYSPGCATVTEISQAEELGVEIVKVFPGAQVGGPAFVKAVLAPCPWTSIMPTGGVESNYENLEAWFKAGVACVGMGAGLISKELVQAGDFQGITRNMKQVIDWIAQIRQKLNK